MYEGKAYEEANVFPGEYYYNKGTGVCYKALSKKELDVFYKKYDCNSFVYFMYGFDKEFINSGRTIKNISEREPRSIRIYLVKDDPSASDEIKTKCPKCGGKMEYVNMAEKCESCWWVKQ